MKKIIVSIFLLLAVFRGESSALERFAIISTEEMQQLVAMRAAGKTDFVLVNCLDEMIFRDAFIPGSINIPLGKLGRLSQRLGRDKSRLIITYCMGYR